MENKKKPPFFKVTKFWSPIEQYGCEQCFSILKNAATEIIKKNPDPKISDILEYLPQNCSCELRLIICQAVKYSNHILQMKSNETETEPEESGKG